MTQFAYERGQSLESGIDSYLDISGMSILRYEHKK